MKVKKQLRFCIKMQSGTAVPANVNLAKQKPYAVSAYSRRVKSLANNAQNFGPNSYINITMDTSTPGSFLDPMQSYLKFDLRVRNKNPFVDFLSFGHAGAASLIEEFRIYVQGTPIEEILQYNVFYENAMLQNGQCQQPFHLFRPSALKQPVSALFGVNAIKPPMVDLAGRPMFGSTVSNQEGTGGVKYSNGPLNQLSLISSMSTYYNKLVLTDFATGLAGATSRAGDVNVAFVSDAQGLYMGQPRLQAGAEGRNTQMVGIYGGAGNFNRTYAPSIDSVLDTTVDGGQSVTRIDTGSYSTGLDNYNATYLNNTLNMSYFPSHSNFYGAIPAGGSCIDVPMGVQRADQDPTNCLNWPFIMPMSVDRPDLKTLGPDNLQDYMMFLANTKYIPIGIQGSARASDPSRVPTPAPTWTDSNFINVTPINVSDAPEANSTYTVCLPLISGVLGSFSEKCWPTMLIAPGSMYIQLRTATVEKAFQLSMDPCRRVLGTIRDYVPFGGSLGGVFGQFSKPGGSNIGAFTNERFGYTAGDYSSYEGIIPYTLNINSSYTKSGAAGYSGEQTVSVDGNNYTYPTYAQADGNISAEQRINAYACIGATLSSANMGNNDINGQDDTIYGSGFGFRPYSVAALEGRWTIGRSYVTQTYPIADNRITSMMGEGTTVGPPRAGSGFKMSVAPNQVLLPAMYWNDVAPIGITQGLDAAVGGAEHVDFGPAGIPLPQYYLHTQPWRMKDFWVNIAKVNKGTLQDPYFNTTFQFGGAQHLNPCSDNLACYGTHLPASVAQARRVLTHTSGQVYVSYVMENIEFISQQIILPDPVSSQILSQAAAGDITIVANSVHNYQTPIGVSSSQNLIIPAKIAAANTIYCLFQPQTFTTGNNACMYNSLRGVNPFGAVYLEQGTAFPGGVGGASNLTSIGVPDGTMNIVNIPCSGAPFQIQLKIGNELIPQQPIVNLNELVTENLKAQHKMFDTLSNLNATYALSTYSRSRLGAGTQNTFYQLSYDVTHPEDFATTFIPVELLDDQTIINNPSMAYVYACQSLYSGDNATYSDYVTAKYNNFIKAYQPPTSTFLIAFDMDTWSRYSDVTRSGKFLGNNTITLSLTNANLLGIPDAQVGAGGFVLQTFVVHDIRFSFQAGGSVVSYY